MGFTTKLFILFCGVCWVIVMMARMGLIRTTQAKSGMQGARLLRTVLMRDDARRAGHRGRAHGGVARDAASEIEVHPVAEVHAVRDVERLRGTSKWSRALKRARQRNY